MTAEEAVLQERLPDLSEQLSRVKASERYTGESCDQLTKMVVRLLLNKQALSIRGVNYKAPSQAVLVGATAEQVESTRENANAILPLSVRFWGTVTVLIGVVSALLGVFMWRLVVALSTGNWGTAWPVPVWGILLSLALFVTIVGGVRHRLTSKER